MQQAEAETQAREEGEGLDRKGGGMEVGHRPSPKTLPPFQLALKHRQGKNHKMRIIAFVGSPVEDNEKDVSDTKDKTPQHILKM